MRGTKESRVGPSNWKEDPNGGLKAGRKQNGLTSLHLLAILRHVVWADGAQKFYVVITVILGHLFSIGFVRALEGREEKGRVILDYTAIFTQSSLNAYLPSIKLDAVKDKNKLLIRFWPQETYSLVRQIKLSKESPHQKTQTATQTLLLRQVYLLSFNFLIYYIQIASTLQGSCENWIRLLNLYKLWSALQIITSFFFLYPCPRIHLLFWEREKEKERERERKGKKKGERERKFMWDRNKDCRS